MLLKTFGSLKAVILKNENDNSTLNLLKGNATDNSPTAPETV